jgi:hypothetical protein
VRSTPVIVSTLATLVVPGEDVPVADKRVAARRLIGAALHTRVTIATQVNLSASSPPRLLSI